MADHIFDRFRSNHEEHEEHEGNAEQGERVVFFFFSPLRALQALHGEIFFFVSWPRSDGEWSKSVFPDESARIGVDPCKPSHWSIRDGASKLTPNPTPICRHLHASSGLLVQIAKKSIFGSPDMAMISTSIVERLNPSTRQYLRRTARATLAFSRKRENHEAATHLHFTYYNLCRIHGTLQKSQAVEMAIRGKQRGIHYSKKLIQNLETTLGTTAGFLPGRFILGETRFCS